MINALTQRLVVAVACVCGSTSAAHALPFLQSVVRHLANPPSAAAKIAPVDLATLIGVQGDYAYNGYPLADNVFVFPWHVAVALALQLDRYDSRIATADALVLSYDINQDYIVIAIGDVDEEMLTVAASLQLAQSELDQLRRGDRLRITSLTWGAEQSLRHLDGTYVGHASRVAERHVLELLVPQIANGWSGAIVTRDGEQTPIGLVVRGFQGRCMACPLSVVSLNTLPNPIPLADWMQRPEVAGYETWVRVAFPTGPRAGFATNVDRLRSAVSAIPQLQVAQLALFKAVRGTDEYSGNTNLFANWLQSTPGDPALLYAQAIRAADRGHLGGAKQMLLECARQGDWSEVEAMLATLANREEDHDAFVRHALRAVELDCYDWRTRVVLAREGGLPPTARARLVREALMLEVDWRAGQVDVTTAIAALGSTPMDAGDVTEELSDASASQRELAQLADSLLALGYFADAERAIEQVPLRLGSALNPRRSTILGLSLYAQDRDDEAQPPLQLAWSLGSRDVRVFSALVTLCADRDDETRATAICRRVQRLEGPWNETDVMTAIQSLRNMQLDQEVEDFVQHVRSRAPAIADRVLRDTESPRDTR